METRHVRLSAAAAASLAAAGIIGSFAALGFAGGTGPAVGEQYGKKVTICHHTQGKGGTKHVTIRVSRNALPAHLRHGDTLGACNTRANRVKHSTKAHAAKFHKPKAAQKGKRGKGKKD
jgi:hypothetical protein